MYLDWLKVTCALPTRGVGVTGKNDDKKRSLCQDGEAIWCLTYYGTLRVDIRTSLASDLLLSSWVSIRA